MTSLPIIDPEFEGLIPPLNTDEHKQLEHNILSSRKCFDAIITWEGIIIDGHNRYAICVDNGIEFSIKEMDFPSRDAVKVWILDNQLARRNLTDAMRIEVALLKSNILRKKAQKRQSRAGGDRTSAKYEGALSSESSKPKTASVDVRKTIAGEAGVSEGNLSNYMQVRASNNPQLLDHVQSGKLKIGTAHRLLPKEIMKQLRKADKDYSYLERVIAANNCNDLPPETRNKLTQLPTLLQELLEKLEGENTSDPTQNQKGIQKPNPAPI
ncbi:MAG: hypothetical protein FWC73_14255 [Defluviitaleaceae bacterium]|nr:hypothetical protein [Defluviitaleaceae bacterium]